ncbi:Peptidase M12A and Metridin ShK toxin domain containing protein [Aphelenchoides besseyi]|nr:Peptidase M12A and Metridin ShK toxin domain containing protein [Aphelenchoides besseyi]
MPAGLSYVRGISNAFPTLGTCLLVVIFLLSVSRQISCSVQSTTPSVLSDEDFANAEKLNKDELFRNAIPVEEVNHYKTDIRGPYANQRRVKRNGVSRTTKLWPQGRIPYAISPHYSTHERALLARAVKQYHDKTCVRFVPRSSGEGDYLFIGKVDGCFSEVGRTSGVQVLSLDNGCMEYPTIIHEMMHVVGFYHEHERWDRDTFIDIIWQNIDRGALDQFGKVDLSKTSYYGQPYDYRSILHYDSLAFSKNGFPTMLPKKAGFASTIGNAKDFSDVDLAKINRMYKCEQRKPVNTIFIPAKAQIAPIYAPPFYKGYNRPAIDGHYPFFEPTKTAPKPICEDRITVCWWTQDRCLSPNIYVMMRNLCAKTCGFC